MAVIERFIHSMKTEGARRILVPLRLGQMRKELGCYVTWYHEHRPHSGIGGALGSDPPPKRPQPRLRGPEGGWYASWPPGCELLSVRLWGAARRAAGANQRSLRSEA